MQLQVRVNPNVMVTLVAEKQKDLFKAVASAYEVFGETTCGLCGSTDIRISWRTATKVTGKKVETYDYPEYQCQAVHDNRRCGGRLSMGTLNDESGTLYPIRRLVDGKRPARKAEKEAGIQGTHGPHRGWYRWEREHDDTPE